MSVVVNTTQGTVTVASTGAAQQVNAGTSSGNVAVAETTSGHQVSITTETRQANATTNEGYQMEVNASGSLVQVQVNDSLPMPFPVPGPPGSDADLGRIVIGETPAGVIDGSNATFTSAFNFIPESVEVKINGLTQKKIDDYNTSGNNTVLFLVSPQPADKILLNYIKV